MQGVQGLLKHGLMPCCPLHPALHCTPVCALSHIPPHATHVSHAHGTSPLALPLTDPLVVQLRAGCAAYPNGTSRGFLNVSCDGRDLVAFEVDKQRWEVRQPSQLAELVSKRLNRQKSVTVLLEYLLSTWICQSNFLSLKRYGRAALERQGETTMTLQQLPQSPPPWGQAVPHRGLPHPFALIPQSCLWPRSSPAPPA